MTFVGKRRFRSRWGLPRDGRRGYNEREGRGEGVPGKLGPDLSESRRSLPILRVYPRIAFLRLRQ